MRYFVNKLNTKMLKIENSVLSRLEMQ